MRFAIHRVPRLVTAFVRSVVPTDLAYQIATLTEINGALIRRDVVSRDLPAGERASR